MYEFSNAMAYATKALDYRSLRQDLISSNIANVDTPHYKSKDISFEAMLGEMAAKEYGDTSKKLQLAQSSTMHMAPKDRYNGAGTVFYRDGHLARNDGNTVDLDVETTEMGKNGVMYNAIISSIKKHKAVFAAVLDSSKNIS